MCSKLFTAYWLHSETVYDDPAVYAKSSPIDFIKQVKAPTLVLAGGRVPAQLKCRWGCVISFWV
jgi:hypothetical protein